MKPPETLLIKGVDFFDTQARKSGAFFIIKRVIEVHGLTRLLTGEELCF